MIEIAFVVRKQLYDTLGSLLRLLVLAKFSERWKPAVDIPTSEDIPILWVAQCGNFDDAETESLIGTPNKYDSCGGFFDHV